MPEVFQFDEENHIYRVSNRIVPSVTQTLQSVGLSPDFRMVRPEVLEHKRQLGQAIHACAEYMLEGDLDESSIDPQFVPYLDALRLFLKDTGFEVKSVEQATHAAIHGMPYGMRSDMTGVMRKEPWMIDLKTTEGAALYPWSIQLSAYENGTPRPLVPPYRWKRGSLQLLSSGRYKFTPWKDSDGDLEEFKAALFLTWRKINRGESPWKGR